MPPVKETSADPRETAVRKKAAEFAKAYRAAIDAGYAIPWPATVDAADALEVSETAAYVGPGEDAAPAPALTTVDTTSTNKAS